MSKQPLRGSKKGKELTIAESLQLALDSAKVRDSKKDKWLARVSDGNGGAYFEDDGESGLLSCQYSQIIPFTKNPPK